MEGKKKITLRDIAAKTGLSVNTVSRVLNKKPYYTKEVEEKVNAACKELGYIVDMNASGLRSGSTHTIAILFDDLINPFYSYTTDIISKRFEEVGYNSIIFSNNGKSAYVDYEMMRSVMARKPDGILSFLEPAEDMVDFIKETGIPFVIFGRDGAPYGMCGVCADEEYGGYVAGKHLLDVFWDGVACYPGEQFEEISSAEEPESNAIRMLFAVPAGSEMRVLVRPYSLQPKLSGIPVPADVEDRLAALEQRVGQVAAHAAYVEKTAI